MCGVPRVWIVVRGKCFPLLNQLQKSCCHCLFLIGKERRYSMMQVINALVNAETFLAPLRFQSEKQL